MSGISDIVNVQITRETIIPAGLSFGWANFVSANASFTPKVRIYGTIEEVDADNTAGADTKAYAALYFGQEIRPTRLYVTKKGVDSYVDALSAAQLVYDDWYGVAIASVATADVSAVAAWVEARTKIFLATGATADFYDPEDTDDILSALQDLGYDRTAFFYHHEAGTKPVGAAPMGLQLPKQPGSSQWAYKGLAGVTPSPLTVADRTAVLNKNGNVYSDRANINVFEQGRMVSGEWIDTMIGIDWMTLEIQKSVYGQLINNEKIPYTDAGVAVIRNAVEAVLKRAVAAGILAATPEPFVQTPLVADVSSSDKGNRILPDVKFYGTLAGAIIKTTVQGRIAI